MESMVYVNGEFFPADEARISVFDRGFLFADAVYEVMAVLGGRLVDNQAHLTRLLRSCREVQLSLPLSLEAIGKIQQELLLRNGLQEGSLYLQLSRGAADVRDFPFPTDVAPTLVMFTQARPLIDCPQSKVGIRVVTLPDLRWKRRDIKTVSLLPACVAKQFALDNDAEDAWWVESGWVTEGSTSNAFILTRGGCLVTRPASHDILDGITRRALLAVAAEEGIRIEERHFSVEEALSAREAFISSATTFVWPVVRINGEAVGDGRPGPVATRLRQRYIERALAGTLPQREP